MDQSLIYTLDGNGSGQKLNAGDFLTSDFSKQNCWVHLDVNQTDAVNWLKQHSQLPELVVDALLEKGNRPRSFEMYDGLHIILRGVNLNPGADPEDMVALRIYLTKKFIITASHRGVMSVEDLVKNLEKGIGPKTTGNLIAQLSDCLTDRIDEVVNQLDARVDDIEDQIIKEAKRTLRVDLADYRREIISLRRYLSPQRDSFRKLYAEPSKFFSEQDRLYLHEVSDRTMRYIEDLDEMREKTIVAQEELASFMAEQVEQRTYLLAIVAAIFLPLTFLTGLLGINVAGIPFAEHKYAFEGVCLLLVVLVAFQLIYFRYKKWL